MLITSSTPATWRSLSRLTVPRTFLTWVKAAQIAGTPAKIKQGLATQLDGWISATEEGSFEGFAREPSPGFAAVHAALTLSWSTGPAEGQINRLKVVKRTLYGRAGFDLFRSRVRAIA
jgi:transposase